VLTNVLASLRFYYRIYKKILVDFMKKYEAIDVEDVRKQFPALSQYVHNHRLIYLDNAATTQKPKSVIDALVGYYECFNSNVYRSVHALAEKSEIALEETRECVKSFINARYVSEIVFTSGTTSSINLVASSYGKNFLKKNDEVLISCMEHHSNIVPWQVVCNEKGAILRVIPISDSGELLLSEFEDLLNNRTKIVSISYVSNVLGTINPIKHIVQKAHAVGAVVFVDAAQAAPHLLLDVKDLDCDFLTFSSHKVYGPTGVGVLYGKKDILESMPPYQTGGKMVKEVSFKTSEYADIPYKFEAGTPNIANIVAFKAALEFIKSISPKKILEHENLLLNCATLNLEKISGLKVIGTSLSKVGLISFVVENVHCLDLCLMLDANGIAVRSGHICAQPLMHRLGLNGVVRASIALYNTEDELIIFVETVERIVRKKIFEP